ncbi:MAG: PAP2 family protein, partial [Bacteroidota bacterium]
MKIFYSLLVAMFATATLSAQVGDTLPKHKFISAGGHFVNPWVSLPAAALGGWGGQIRLKKLQDKPDVTRAEIEALSPDDVP